MISLFIVLAGISHLFNNSWTISFAGISVGFDLSSNQWHCSLEVLISLCFLSVSFNLGHIYARVGTHTLTPLPRKKWVSSSPPSSSVGLDLPQSCSETSWFVWQTQMPLNSPQHCFLPASYLVMHNSHPLSHPPLTSPPALFTSGKGTAAHDSAGRKSIRPWRLCFKWAINGTASQF